MPDDPVPDDPLPGDPAAATPYEGPAFVLDVDADGGPRVRVEVPTGGYRLVADGIETVDGVQRLECTLEGPADDELVTQAFETLTLDWPGGFDRSRPAEVAVSRTVRGREYFVPPPHLVAVRHDADR